MTNKKTGSIEANLVLRAVIIGENQYKEKTYYLSGRKDLLLYVSVIVTMTKIIAETVMG